MKKANNWDIEMEDCGQPAQLLQAWRDKTLKEFERVLGENCNTNHIYSDDKYLPILGIIARDADPNDNEALKYVEALIASNVNLETQYANGMYAIHLLCEKGNLSILKALVSAGADVNAKERTGSTPLHVVIQRWKGDFHRKCLEYLLSQSNTNFNAINNAGFVPIHLAVSKKNKTAVKILLEKGSLLQLDDTNVGFDKITPRKAIVDTFPDLENDLPPLLGPDWSFVKMDSSKLFNLLNQGEVDRFCIAFEKEMQDKSQKGLLTATNGKQTLLQVACQRTYYDAVKIILESGADVNFSVDGDEPIRIVTRNGDSGILNLLLRFHPRLSSDKLGRTILHTLVMDYKDDDKYRKCLDTLLSLAKNRSYDINAQDEWGDTALHYAVLEYPEILVPVLLNNGAYLAISNHKGDTPLKWLPPTILEDYLNSMIDESEKNIASENYSMTFNYQFLIPPEQVRHKTDEETPLKVEEGALGVSSIDRPLETTPLLAMTAVPGMRKLVTHPVLTSFTYLKWQRIRLFFYINLAFYLVFCFLMTSYIIFGHMSNPSQGNATETLNEVSNELVSSTSPSNLNKSFFYGLRLLLLIFLGILVVRELFQAATTRLKYLTNLENWLEILLIAMSASIIIEDCPSYLFVSSDLGCPQKCAIVILISWVELFLLFGKHPLCSIQMEMLNTVSKSFVRYLGLYIILIIGFALSFYVLFHEANNAFMDPGNSFFKTIVMAAGEFEFGEIPFITYIGTSHVIFAIFEFVIAIILLNLLNGLAVADTKELRDDAYLSTCIARVQLLFFVENLLQSKSPFLKSVINKCSCCPSNLMCCCRILNYFSDKLIFFQGLIPVGIIRIRPNQGNRIEVIMHTSISNDADDYCKGNKAKLLNYEMDSNTINMARTVLAAKRAVEFTDKEPHQVEVANAQESEFFKEKLSELEKKLEALDQSIKQVEKLLIQNIAIVSLNNANNEK